jgi:hypothetical protein
VVTDAHSPACNALLGGVLSGTNGVATGVGDGVGLGEGDGLTVGVGVGLGLNVGAGVAPAGNGKGARAVRLGSGVKPAIGAKPGVATGSAANGGVGDGVGLLCATVPDRVASFVTALGVLLATGGFASAQAAAISASSASPNTNATVARRERISRTDPSRMPAHRSGAGTPLLSSPLCGERDVGDRSGLKKKRSHSAARHLTPGPFPEREGELPRTATR